MQLFGIGVAPPPTPPPPMLETSTIAIIATTLAIAATLATRIGYLSAALLGGSAALGILYFQQPDVYGAYVWPPSRESAPALATVSAAFAAIAIYSFAAVRKSEDAERVKQDKCKLIAAQLTQAMRWDEEEEETKEGDEDEKEEAPAAAPTDEAKDKADEKEEEAKESTTEDEKEKKRPPEVSDLFKMLFDEIEERHVTDFGIASDDEAYRGILDLFKAQVSLQLAEAERCTRLSRCGGAEGGEDLVVSEADRAFEDDVKRVALFSDGARLKELVELYEKKIVKFFGSKLVSAATLKAAKATLAAVDLSQRKGAFEVLYKLIVPSLPLYLASSILMAFDSAVGAATYHATARLLDGVSDGSVSVEQLRAEMWAVFFKFVLCVFSHLTSCSFTEKCAGRFANSVRVEVLRGVLRQDTVFFDVYPSGVIQERLNHDADTLAGKIFHMPMHLLHCSLHVITNAHAVYSIRSDLFWMVVGPIPLISFLQRKFIAMMERMHERSRKVGEHVVASTNEMVRELRTVRSFAMEGEEADLYAVKSQYKTEINEWASIIHHVFFISPLIMMFLSMRLFAIYMAGTYVAVGAISVGMAIQMGSCCDHLQHSIRAVLDMAPDIIKVKGPIGRVCDAINSRPTIEPYPGMPPKLTTPIKGRIEFKDVNFTFPSEPAKQILFDLSFEAAAGKKVAFVGATGCGKSTSIQLIQRFYSASSGQVLLDGIPIEQFDVHYLRRQISVVAQDNVLFSTTIRENITYGLPKKARDLITTDDVEAACRKANAWDFINAFPRKLETYCGERGVKLSGGQKQRLAIARAIIRKPKICLLDEATSALDSKSEEVVQAALDKMIEENASGCTIVIAHRLSTVKNCDTILCMQKGHVLERGSHDELLKIPITKSADGKTMVAGLYHDLWKTQMGDEKKDGEKTSVTVKRLMGEVAALKKQLAYASSHSAAPVSPREAYQKELNRFRKPPGTLAKGVSFKENSETINLDGDIDEEDGGVPAPLMVMRSKTAPSKSLAR